MTEYSDAAKALISTGKQHETDEKTSLVNEFTSVAGRAVSDFDSGKTDGALLRSFISDNQSGRSNKQLGSGGGDKQQSSDQLDERTALQTLLNSPELNEGQQAVLRRVFAPVGDAGKLTFDSNGDDTRIAELKREKTKVSKEKEEAEQKLANERDASKSDSLAGQLKAANEEIKNLKEQLKAAKQENKGQPGTPQSPQQGAPPRPNGIFRGVRESFGGGQR